MTMRMFWVNCLITGTFLVIFSYLPIPDLTPLGNLAIWLGPLVYIWTRHRLRGHTIEYDRVSWVSPALPRWVREVLLRERVGYLEGQLAESQKNTEDL